MYGISRATVAFGSSAQHKDVAGMLLYKAESSSKALPSLR